MTSMARDYLNYIIMQNAANMTAFGFKKAAFHFLNDNLVFSYCEESIFIEFSILSGNTSTLKAPSISFKYP